MSAKKMHLVAAMKHKKYIIRVRSNSKRDTWFVLGMLLFVAIVFIALIEVLIEAPVSHYPW